MKGSGRTSDSDLSEGLDRGPSPGRQPASQMAVVWPELVCGQVQPRKAPAVKVLCPLMPPEPTVSEPHCSAPLGVRTPLA